MPNQPTPDDSDEPVVEPTVGELLVARIDEPCRLLHLEFDNVAKACEQLAPERARSCRNAITMASVMVDEIRLRAHARRSTSPKCEVSGAPGQRRQTGGTLSRWGSGDPERTAPRVTCAPGGPFRGRCRTTRTAVPRGT
jgi:hypothetical protein